MQKTYGHLHHKQFIHRVILIICMSLGRHSIYAQLSLQANTVYRHYTSYNSGLPSGLVYRIIEDDYGYIWLATDNGLVRYNGTEFTLVNTGKKEDFINAFRVKNAQLWLIAYPSTTTAIDMNTQTIIKTDSIYGLNNHSKNPYILQWQQHDTLILGKSNMKSVAIIPGENAVLSADSFAPLLFRYYNIPLEKYGFTYQTLYKQWSTRPYLIRTTDSSITIYNKIAIRNPGHEATLFFDGDDYGINDCIMAYAKVDNDLYIACIEHEGLIRIEHFFSAAKPQQHVTRLLQGIHPTDLIRDYRGNIWISTKKDGVYFFPQNSLRTLYYDHEHSGLFSNNITLIEKDGPATVIGYNNAVLDASGPGKKYRRYPLNVDNIAEQAPKVFISYRGNKYLFTTNCLLKSCAGKTKTSDDYRFKKIDNNLSRDARISGDNLWAATYNGFLKITPDGTIHINTTDTLPRIVTIQPVTDSSLYLGTISGVYYNDHALPYLRDVYINKVRLIGNRLFFCTATGAYSLPADKAYDSTELLQIASEASFDIKPFKDFIYIRTANGLLIIRGDNLRHIAQKNFKEYAIPFNISDFVPDSNYIAVAGNRGIFYFSPEELLPRVKEPDTKIYILNSLHNYLPGDTMMRYYYHKKLVVFLTLDILDHSTEQKDIAYRILKDGEELYPWTNIKKDPLISIRQPSPGNYTIQYKVTWPYTDKVIIKKYVLVILPLWWQTTAFRFLTALLIIALLGGTSLLIIHRIKQRNEHKMNQQLALYELESQSLLAQLKPHFLFNVLTPLQHYFIKGDKMGGLDYVDNLSALMRSLLDEIRDKYATLEQEIVFIENYLNIQQKRYDYCFKYTIAIEDDVPVRTVLIPTLLVQPLVENAIEHGISKDRTDGQITIYITGKLNFITITVTDNGGGLPHNFTVAGNHALTIIQERMDLIQKQKGTGSFHIRNNTGAPGVTAILVVPKMSQ
ncbi:sensor histidine kinase [Chitinophagaceae bacterium MMS25-I14]